MLYHPGVVVAESVGQLHLGERVLVEPQLAVGLPGTRQLQLVENAELHFVASRIVAPEAEHSRGRALLPMPAVQGGKAVLPCFTLSRRNGGRGEIYRRASAPRVSLFGETGRNVVGPSCGLQGKGRRRAASRRRRPRQPFNSISTKAYSNG